jgi:CRP-like cAMP-binding protein
MVSPELLRRYAFFGGLEIEHIDALARVAEELTVEEGHFFFHEEDALDYCYVLLEGEVEVLTELPDKGLEAVTTVVAEGEMFGWSGLIPPYEATAAARASAQPCRVVAFDCVALRQQFEADPRFGYLLTQRITQVMRERLSVLRIESLAYTTLQKSN